jgi:hypothetical protein
MAMQDFLQARFSMTRTVLLVITLFLCSMVSVAEDTQRDWSADLEVYGWLPNIELESEDGSKSKITRDDILKDLDLAAMWAGRVRKGRWSISSDFIYFKISDKSDLSLLSPGSDPGQISDTSLQAWIVTPNVGYMLRDNDTQRIELYAGARYFWTEFDITIDFDPLLPGLPSGSRTESPSLSSWDGIVGVRGLYHLPDKWYLAYSANAGAGDSDFTWSAQGGFGYELSKVDALFGWRYLDYDVGDDTLLKRLTVNGPFAGVMFRW